jgi:thiol:disulfide interchange protein DsbD
LTLALTLAGVRYSLDVVAVSDGAAVTRQAENPRQPWQTYTPERLQGLLSEGRPVFVNMTAAWCISCLVNERVALSDDSVIEAFKSSGVTYLKGDWTNKNEQISRYLGSFGRSGVPLYVYYPPGVGSEAVVLPQLLTPEIVREQLLSAHPSHHHKESS